VRAIETGQGQFRARKIHPLRYRQIVHVRLAASAARARVHSCALSSPKVERENVNFAFVSVCLRFTLEGSDFSHQIHCHIFAFLIICLLNLPIQIEYGLILASCKIIR
jgi:hypothetical protein